MTSDETTDAPAATSTTTVVPPPPSATSAKENPIREWWDAHVVFPLFRWGTKSSWVQPVGGATFAREVVDVNYAEMVVGGLLIALMTVVGSGEKWGSACSFTTGALLVPVARRGLFTWVTGISYERGIKYHRWMATLLFVYCCVHGIMQGHYLDHKGLEGTLAWIVLGAMLVLSLPYVRRKFFEMFYYTHVLFVAFLVLGTLHAGSTLLACFVPGILYIVEVLLRVRSAVKERSNVRVLVVSDDCVELSFDNEADFTYHAGQYCFVAFPRLGRLDFHPFTISSAPHEKRVTMHIRALGDWTSELLEIAKTDSSALLRVEVAEAYGEHRALCSTKNFTSLKLVGGGVGITPVMALLKQFTHELLTDGVARRVHAVWLVRSTSVFTWFADTLIALREHFPGIATAHPAAGDASHAGVTMDLFVTRTKEDGEAHGLAYRAGRPDWAAVFAAWHKEAMAGRAADAAGKARVAVFACGPDALCHELRALCAAQSDKDVTFYFLEETFEF